MKRPSRDVSSVSIGFGSLLALGAAVAFTSVASADEMKLGGQAKASSTTASSSTTATTTKAPAAPKEAGSKEVPRDPAGVTGISPFWEAIVQGDSAFLGQDLAGAKLHYQKAVTHSPKNPIGYLRLAQVSLKGNEVAPAAEFVASALRFATDVRDKAHARFLAALVEERRAAYDAALTSWHTYRGTSAELPPAGKAEPGKGPQPPVVYVETADQRAAAISAKKSLDEQYKPVSERIQKEIEKADEATGVKAGEGEAATAPGTPPAPASAKPN